ncbi:MAG: hypothetical protein KAJ19_15175, partial [Gammaproteobacteria bacterium]|nr:hypothetical protein [Gammaproteobacteria bacterium]
ARLINDAIPSRIATKVKKALGKIPNPKIVALGFAYKADTYDTRNSPALTIIDILKQDGYHIEAYDPIVEAAKYRPILELARGVDCLVILVEHTVIKRELDQRMAEIKSIMRQPIILRFYPDSQTD